MGRKSAITPEDLIRDMEDPSMPGTVNEILKSTGLSSATVSNWCKADKAFKKKYEAAKRYMKVKTKPKENRSLRNLKTGWEDNFLAVYSITGRFNHASEMADVHPDTVHDRLEPDSSTHDPVFAARFQVAEARLNRTLEDIAHERAIEDASDGMIKFLLQSKVARYGKTITHNNLINATIEYKVVEERARKFLSSIFGDIVEGEIIEHSSADQPRQLSTSL